MPLYEFEGRVPSVAPGAWIAPTAVLVGRVRVAEGASVWFNAVIRADAGEVTIGRGTNVQDGSVLHGGLEGLDVGDDVTIGHSCMIHCSAVGYGALIGNGAVVLDHASIGEEAVVAANSTVLPGAVIPPRTLAVGSPARIKPMTDAAGRWVRTSAQQYRGLALRYIEGLNTNPIEPEEKAAIGVVRYN